MEFIILYDGTNNPTTAASLCAALIEIQKTELMPNDVEIKTMETFLDVLKPIVEITEAIGGERLVTISTVRSLVHKLMSIHLVEKSSDSQLSKTLKHALLTDLKARYTATELKDFLNIACFLDPRFKNMSFLSDTSKVLVEGEAEKILLRLSERKVSDSESSPTNVAVGRCS